MNNTTFDTLQGFDGHGQPILKLYFRVQYYVDQVVLLRLVHGCTRVVLNYRVCIITDHWEFDIVLYTKQELRNFSKGENIIYETTTFKC
mgnify:CR=1 FL=1